MVLGRVQNRAGMFGQVSEQLYCVLDLCHALLGFLSSGVLEISVEVMRRDACYRVISLAFKLCLW